MVSIAGDAAEYLDAKRRLADAVNGAIKIRVRWHVVRRAGRTKANVCHIRLDERLLSGPLRRKSGDLLCGATSKGVEMAEGVDSAGQTYPMEVTCKTCLERARALSNLIDISQLKKQED